MRIVLAASLLVACAGPPAPETPPPSGPVAPTTVGTPPPPTTAAPSQRAVLLDQYEECHATLREQRDARSSDHRRIARLTVERDAARATVEHTHGAAQVTARATLADLEDDLREAQGRYDAERASVRVSEDACNRIQDQIRALPH